MSLFEASTGYSCSLFVQQKLIHVIIFITKCTFFYVTVLRLHLKYCVQLCAPHSKKRHLGLGLCPEKGNEGSGVQLLRGVAERSRADQSGEKGSSGETVLFSMTA